MVYFTIYKTTNLINGKIYIGAHKTQNLDDKYLGSSTRFNNARKKYGDEAFKKEILFIFDNEQDMFAKEAELVTEEFSKDPNTYNVKPGGTVVGHI